jgi:hypothetical protein
MKTQARLLLFCSAALLAMAGCTSLKTVNVRQDAALSGASVAVDVVAITTQNANLETASVRDYWRPGSGLRKPENASTLRFGVGQPDAQSVSKNWKALGAKKVIVFADLPGVFADLPGDADPRRKSISVGKSATVTVRMSPSGLTVESP